MSACNCCTEPPVVIGPKWERFHGSYKDDTKTEAEVVSEALSIISSGSYDSYGSSGWMMAQFYWDHTYGGAGGFKSRFKIWHQPTPSCYLKVWLREIYTPIEEVDGVIVPTGSSTSTSITPAYEWVGDGPVCLTDPVLAVDDPANEILSPDWYYVSCPTEYAQKDIEIKYSYIPGYEPAWP